LTALVSLADSRYSDAGKQAAFYRELLTRMENLPGAESVAIASTLPAGGADQLSFRLKGQENLPPGERSKGRYFVVSPDFFHTARIQLIRGRVFSDSDGAGGPPVAVVSEVFARRFFPKGDAIGQQVMIDTGVESGSQWREIVGIVGNVKGWPLSAADDPEIYENYWQRPGGEMALMVRTRGNPDALAPGLREAVWGVSKDQPIASVMSFADRIGNQIAGDRLFVAMLGVFAALALGLSGVGLYGLVAYTVELRTQEIGIRMALGANTKRILKQVVGDGMRLAATGAAIGMALGLPLPRVLEGMLQDFRVGGGWVYLLIPGVLGVVALLACYVPARKAARVDPMLALHYE
jgi:predicted permease